MMKRNEAVQKLATVGRLSMAHAEDLYDSIIPKPVVPKYVADWYEENKDDFEVNLFNCICEAVENYAGSSSNEFENWLMSKELEVIQTLVNMHQFGYEVEEEPRYTVEIKGFDDDDTFLNYNTDWDYWFLEDDKRTEEVRVAHTRKELEEADFGWVFDCPGVEVKEVE
jgi:gp178